ncbi:guanylate kinase [Companilactobacillus versmoldensis]|uniref:Guanylate kinase n=1 Tax=Companilactobacillus versmoldensis DSM 14857 = KCTC 3814 TaxID=1423815 RepID=A0A0R1SGH5_9LACO|nr:guanylate kinase [Companilactobacillus versmoldensis]KRL68383.1 guanylate kinase [Companilactobacillus versmoldensis DSM 14857 = KCTC 3814]
MSSKGMLIVLSGPSGVGKGTVRKAMLETSTVKFDYSVSMTTRNMRPGEQDGVDYYFRTNEQFENEIKNGGMLEYAKYVDHYYGTPLKYVQQKLDAGIDVLLEIEVNGAMQVREKMPNGVFIFLTPPDLPSLRSRITHRGTDDQKTIDKRMEQAKKEIAMMSNYDYAVVNDKIPNAVKNIEGIIRSEHLSVPRVIDKYKKIIGED